MLVRAHIKRYGTTTDGRISRPPGAASARTRPTARCGLRPASRPSLRPSTGRAPYDLRHAAVSLWLNSGVPDTEVARRAGHGVAVLLKIYAHCVDGRADAANQRITDALAAQDIQPEPGDDGDDDNAEAS